jgi:hypothetical protein
LQAKTRIAKLLTLAAPDLLTKVLQPGMIPTGFVFPVRPIISQPLDHD